MLVSTIQKQNKQEDVVIRDNTTNLSMTTMGDLLILYGSQTGTAQELAHRALREARRNAPHLTVRLRAADAYDVRALVEERGILCFVCSTTGQGEEPDNMKKVKWFCCTV